MTDGLLQHMMAPCTDPDCEIHNIEVGCEEGAVKQSDLAFWLSGARWMAEQHTGRVASAEFSRAIQHVARCVGLIPERTVETDLAEDR